MNLVVCNRDANITFHHIYHIFHQLKNCTSRKYFFLIIFFIICAKYIFIPTVLFLTNNPAWDEMSWSVSRSETSQNRLIYSGKKQMLWKILVRVNLFISQCKNKSTYGVRKTLLGTLDFSHLVCGGSCGSVVSFDHRVPCRLYSVVVERCVFMG